MGTSNYSDDFKRDAVHQITVRGYPVAEVSKRLGVSTHSLYKWVKLFCDPASKTPDADHEAENRRLKRELARVTEERDLLKRQQRASPRVQSAVRLLRRASLCVLGAGEWCSQTLSHNLSIVGIDEPKG